MKAVFVAGGGIAVREVPAPSPLEEEIIVRMNVCGLCGSDLEKLTNSYGMVSSRLGHEPVGEITKVGEKVQDFRISERVFIHHHVPCYSCHYCLHSSQTMCDSYQENNLEPCGLSEEFLVSSVHLRRGGVLKLPKEVTDEEAALIEPLACCIRALNKCKIKTVNDVVILGAGPVGMMNGLLARDAGVKATILVDPNDFRLEFGKRMGFDVLHPMQDSDKIKSFKQILNGRGADLAIVATGDQRAFSEALKMVRKGGTVLLFGVPPKSKLIEVDLSSIYSNEISVVPSYAATEIETTQALKLLAEKHLGLRSLITHRFDLRDSDVAFRCAYNAKDVMKVVITNKKKK